MPKKQISVVVVHDSLVFRNLLEEALAGVANVVVSGAYAHERQLLAVLGRVTVDVAIVPLACAGALLRRLGREYPDLGVVLAGTAARYGPEKKAKALELGALGLVARTESFDRDTARASLTSQLRPLFSVYNTRRISQTTKRLGKMADDHLSATARTPRDDSDDKALSRAAWPSRIDVVAVGVSLGGPAALQRFLPLLPPDLGVPVLVVQHMPARFTEALARRLDSASFLPVREACHGEPVLPNQILLAPGGLHMTVARQGAGSDAARVVVRCEDGPMVHGCRPAVDVLFASVAQVYAGCVLAVVMTGMGKDGCDGVRALKARGCYCITQTEATCTVYGMSEAVDRAELSDERVALENLAQRTAEVVKRPPRRRARWPKK